MNFGGYNSEFVQVMDCDTEDFLLCKICHLPSRGAQLSECCGHTFCKSCLDQMHKTSGNTTCPVCCNDNLMTIFNKQVDRRIRSLHVFCSNKDKGCEWQGELNNINSHLENDDGCGFEDVPCSALCGKMVQRRCLTNHKETVCPYQFINCQHCNLSGERQFITGEHVEICPKAKMQCPNHCDAESILREDIDEHRKVCSHEMVSCKYMKLGCGARMARKEEEIHSKEKMEEHLQLTTHRLEKMENILSQLMWLSQLSSKAESSSNGTKVSPVVMKIAGFANMRKEKSSWKSCNFYTHDEGYEMSVGVKCIDLHLSMHLYIHNGKYDDYLAWPLRGKFDIKVYNQIDDKEHYLRQIVYSDKCPDSSSSSGSDGWGRRKFLSYDRLCATSSTCQYVKDDKIYLEISYNIS